MWTIGTLNLQSHLLLGTASYADPKTMAAVHVHAQTEMVTLDIRQMNIDDPDPLSTLQHIDRSTMHVVPTTAGCLTPDDAVSTAHIAAEMLDTQWVKLHVAGCSRARLPDMEGTLEAARELVREGFHVMPSCLDDPVLCARLADIGCVAIFAMAAPFEASQGVVHPKRLALLRNMVSVPIIIDTGRGSPSDANLAMELGVDAVFADGAIAAAKDPILMAQAMKLAVQSGRAAFQAGGMHHAQPAPTAETTPDTMAPANKGA